MKAIIYLVLLLTFGFGAAAQTAGTVKGVAKDASGNPAGSTTIALLRVKDSATVKLTTADKTGMYLLENIKSGRYFLTATAVGHATAYSQPFDLTEATPTVTLPEIILKPVDKSLQSVTVTARRPLVEQRIDRTIVNVEASITNAGGTALEVLEKSPGLTVDKDGNISLKGKQGVLVLVDGRQTQLGATELANLLRSMNASQLDQIEIMTNPPAKYDAAGNAGIINIKTKKNRQLGYNGSINVNYVQGYVPKVNDGFNFNYRQGKWNLFTNLSHGYNQRWGWININRNFVDEATKERTSTFSQQARMNREGSSYNGKVGADYFASSKTTIGIALSGFSNTGEGTVRNTTDIERNVAPEFTRTITRTTDVRDFKNVGVNLNLRHVLDSAGSEITADADYLAYKGRNSQRLNSYDYNKAGSLTNKGDTLLGYLPQEIQIWSGRVDYLKPLKGGVRFEAGLKTSIVRTDNDATYDSVIYGAIVRDRGRSNHFIYNENINAAYVNISGPLSKKWSGQLGLRLENTNADGEQKTTGQTFRRRYTQLFPTAYLQHTLNDKNTFVLNYGRRLRRPNYESLNPFIQFLDKYTFQQGNPELKPQFSHNIELSHTYKGFLTTTANYSRTTDIIQQVIEQNEAANETFVRQANIAKQTQYGVAVNVNHAPTKWWTNSLFVNGFYNRFEGLINNAFVRIDATTLVMNATQQFKLSKSLTAELSGWYRTAGIEGVFQARPMGSLNAGLSKNILKDKGTLRFNIRDIFYTQQFRAIAKYDNVDATIAERNEPRIVSIGFTYRFNKGKVNGAPKKRASSASDEQNRVGGN